MEGGDLDVEKDLQEMKVKRWREKTVDREDRASVIKESKALRGPQIQDESQRWALISGSL